MLKGHFTSAGASINHGDANVLFPVQDLNAPLIHRRDAELTLADTDSEDVIVVVPTSLASSYFLTQHPLTAIPIDELTPTVRSQLDNSLDVSIETFDIIQIGKWNSDSLNHSLTEYTDA